MQKLAWVGPRRTFQSVGYRFTPDSHRVKETAMATAAEVQLWEGRLASVRAQNRHALRLRKILLRTLSV